jgi:hypothetical protein
VFRLLQCDSFYWIILKKRCGCCHLSEIAVAQPEKEGPKVCVVIELVNSQGDRSFISSPRLVVRPHLEISDILIQDVGYLACLARQDSHESLSGCAHVTSCVDSAGRTSHLQFTPLWVSI